MPARRNEAAPLAACEQQDVEDDAVHEPEHVDAEVPPARESDRVADARQPDVLRQRDASLASPSRAGSVGHVLLHAEPLFPGRRVPRPVQPGMVGQDLKAGADDEDQEEQVQEVLNAQPDRHCVVEVSRGSGPRVPQDELLDLGNAAKALRRRDAHSSRAKADRQQPQQVEPSIRADSQPRRDAGCGWDRAGPRVRMNDIFAARELGSIVLDRGRREVLGAWRRGA